MTFWSTVSWSYTDDDLLELADAERVGILSREEAQSLRGQAWPSITFGMEIEQPSDVLY